MAQASKAKIDGVGIGIGIDFGTTNSVVATSDRSKRTKAFLKDASPHPSVVWYQVSGEPQVGRVAKNNIHGYSEAPGNVFISSVKRSLGKDKTYSIFGAKHHATEVAAEIFKHLKTDARQHHDLEVTEAVVHTHRVRWASAERTSKGCKPGGNPHQDVRP